MKFGLHAQQTLVDLTLLIAVTAAIGVGLLGFLAGDSVRSIVLKASATLLGVGFAGWLVALAATPTWFKAPPDTSQTTEEGDGPQ